MLKILGRQNTTIAELNADADVIFAQLADRREDVVSFIDNAEDTARDLGRAPRGPLARLRPARRLPLRAAPDDGPSSATSPRADPAAAGPLRRRSGPEQAGARTCPASTTGPGVSPQALGDAAEVGGRALEQGLEEIAELNTAEPEGRPPRTTSPSSSRASTIRAGRRGGRPGHRRPARADRGSRLNEPRHLRADQSVRRRVDRGPGYTGIEGLLNYAYYQTLSLNLFDSVGPRSCTSSCSRSRRAPCGQLQRRPEGLRRAAYTTGGPADPRTAACAGDARRHPAGDQPYRRPARRSTDGPSARNSSAPTAAQPLASATRASAPTSARRRAQPGQARARSRQPPPGGRSRNPRGVEPRQAADRQGAQARARSSDSRRGISCRPSCGQGARPRTRPTTAAANDLLDFLLGP